MLCTKYILPNILVSGKWAGNILQSIKYVVRDTISTSTFSRLMNYPDYALSFHSGEPTEPALVAARKYPRAVIVARKMDARGSTRY